MNTSNTLLASRHSITEMLLTSWGLAGLAPIVPPLGILYEPMEGMVFRVQLWNDKFGGPYSAADLALSNRLVKHSRCPDHPGPGRSWPGTSLEWDEYFGFASIEGLLCWFDQSDFRALSCSSFVLGVYKGLVSAVCQRTEQCKFYLPTADLLTERHLNETWHTL